MFSPLPGAPHSRMKVKSSWDRSTWLVVTYLLLFLSVFLLWSALIKSKLWKDSCTLWHVEAWERVLVIIRLHLGWFAHVSWGHLNLWPWAGLLIVQGVSNTDVSEISQYNGSNLKKLEQWFCIGLLVFSRDYMSMNWTNILVFMEKLRWPH